MTRRPTPAPEGATIREANMAFGELVFRAGSVALSGAQKIKYWGAASDWIFAEASATIATAAATASHAVDYADFWASYTTLAAEAVHTAIAGASHRNLLRPLYMLAGLFQSALDWIDAEATSEMETLFALITTAAAKAAHFVDTMVEVATTTAANTDLAPFDMFKLVDRLQEARTLAMAVASVARAAAGAVRGTYPALSTRATRDAGIAMDASTRAAPERLKLLLARSDDRYERLHIGDWLTTLETFASNTQSGQISWLALYETSHAVTSAASSIHTAARDSFPVSNFVTVGADGPSSPSGGTRDFSKSKTS